MRSLFIFICLFLLACNSSVDPSGNGGNCSAFITTADGTSVQNNYFKTLDNGMILSVISKEFIGKNQASSNYTFAPVYPEDMDGKWQLEFSGNDFEISKNTLVVSEKVANEDVLYSLYSLNSGNKIIEYTYDKFEVIFSDENEKRFLGFYSQNAAGVKNGEFNFGENTFGFLNYANAEGKISKVRIDAIDNMWLDIFDVTNPVIELIPFQNSAIELNSGKTLYFTSSDGSLSEEINFDIQFTYYTKDTYKPTSFRLEVRGDKIMVPDDFSNTVFDLESL